MIRNLIKINVTALFAGVFRRLRGGKKLRLVSVILIGLLVIYVVCAILFAVGAMFYGLCAPLFSAGLAWLYFALEGILVFAICFIGGIFMVQSQIFSARDNELLLSMPIKPPAILIGRLSALLIIEYVFELVVMLPVFVVLLIRGNISQLPALGIVFYFIAAVLLPLLALAVGCLVGWLVALAASRMRKKNLPTLILSLLFLAAYLWGYTRLMGNLNALVSNGVEIAEAVRRTLLPAYHLGVAIADGNVLSFLIFAVCAIVPFTLMCVLLSVSFVKLTTAGRGAKKLEYHEKTARASGARMALLKRELRHYWASPMYIINTSLGVIAALVLAVILIVRPGLITGVFDPGAGVFSGIDAGLAAAIVLSALAAVNFVSAPTISLEGKNLWIVKSLPAPTRDILMSKVGLQLAVCIPAIFVAGIVSIAALPNGGAITTVLTLVMPASVTLMFSLLGVTLNLAFPRFDWLNEIQPVKQGASTMLSMFGGMALIAALAIVYIFLLSGALAPDIYLLLCTLVFIIASAGLYLYLIKGGCRRFDAL